jgi:hypothetical protein
MKHYTSKLYSQPEHSTLLSVLSHLIRGKEQTGKSIDTIPFYNELMNKPLYGLEDTTMIDVLKKHQLITRETEDGFLINVFKLRRSINFFENIR